MYVRSLASFYVEQVLWTGDPDHYRVLGVARDAAQERIVENLRAALVWLVPYVGTARWEGDYASAVVAAGRAIGTADERIAYDLATWSNLAAASTPAPRKAIWRAVAVVIALLAWLAVMPSNFPAGGVIDAPVAGRTVETSGLTEARPSIALVQVRVVSGPDPVAAVPAPQNQAVPALLAESEEPPATSASTDLPSGATMTAARVIPDFDTAFQGEGAAPEVAADVSSTAPAENPSSTVQPPTAVVASDETAGATGETAQPLDSIVVVSPGNDAEAAPATEDLSPSPQPDELLDSTVVASGANDAEAAPAATEDLSPSPQSELLDSTVVASVANDAEAAPATEDLSPSPQSDELLDSTGVASVANDAEAAPVATEDLSPSSQPDDRPDASALAAKPLEEVATAAPPIDASPSFKCSRARTTVELAICGDSALARKDRELAQLYRQVRRSLAGSSRASATSRQMIWLRDRDSCGGSATCIFSAYDSRIRELAVLLNPP